jgi:hypothetical protein
MCLSKCSNSSAVINAKTLHQWQSFWVMTFVSTRRQFVNRAGHRRQSIERPRSDATGLKIGSNPRRSAGRFSRRPNFRLALNCSLLSCERKFKRFESGTARWGGDIRSKYNDVFPTGHRNFCLHAKLTEHQLYAYLLDVSKPTIVCWGRTGNV